MKEKIFIVEQHVYQTLIDFVLRHNKIFIIGTAFTRHESIILYRQHQQNNWTIIRIIG